MDTFEYEIAKKINAWRFRTFKLLAWIGIIMGAFTLAFSIRASLANNLPFIAILDVVVYALWVFNALVAYASACIRYLVFLALLYLLGISLLVLVGPFAGGLNWLFIFSGLSAIFFQKRHVYIALGINTATVLLLYGLFYIPVFLPSSMAAYGQAGFMAVGSNFLLMNAALVIPTMLMVDWLRLSLQKEIKHKKQMLAEKNQLKKAKAKAEESDRLKTEFLHNISHEIRTPMNAIKGFSSLLSPSLPAEQQQSYIRHISKSTDQLLFIVNNSVELANIETGNHAMPKGPVNATQILYNIYEDMNHKTEEGIHLLMRIKPKNETTFIHGNAHALYQTMLNLVDNGLKFTEEGWVKMGYARAKKDKVLFFVRDTGIGIKPEEQARIFNKFHKSPDGKAHFVKGIGLGSSLAKAYVTKMDGKIWLKSRPGKGTTIFFMLNLSHSAQTQ